MTFDKLVNNMYNSNCSGDMMIEPRLMEYLKKKEYYKTNKLEACIKPEVEFQITKEDIKLLKEFRKSGKDIYSYRSQNLNKRLNKSLESCQSNQSKPSFPSSSFKDDSRVPQIEKSSNKQNMTTPAGYTSAGYTSEGYDVDNAKYNPRIDPRMDPGAEKYNPRQSQFYIPRSTQKYCVDQDPRNKYILSDLDHTKHNNSVSDFDNVFNQSISSHASNQSNPSNMIDSESEWTNQNKQYSPKLRKNLNTSKYTFKTFNEVSVPINSQLESDLLRGMPTYRPRNKSYGYRNPDENYFDYIDCNFQNSDNTVEGWIRGGESTRLDNKFQTKNRNYTRQVL